MSSQPDEFDNISIKSESLESFRQDDRVFSMKLGCFGCLSVFVVVLSILALGGGALWVWGRIQATPPLLRGGPSKADPTAVERRLAELWLRAAGRSTRVEPVVLSEPEIAAFLARHLE